MARSDEPLARRRTPRKASTPARLGHDDNWGNSPAGKWVTEEKKSGRRANKSPPSSRSKSPAPAPARKATASKKKASAKGGAVNVESFYGCAIAVAGDVIAEVGISGRNYDAMRFFAFCLWGLVLSNILTKYLTYLSKQSFNKNKMVDSALKAVFNQALISPLIVGLFIVFSTTILGGERDPDAITNKLATGLVPMWKASAAYWLVSDTLMLSLQMPVEKQVLFNMASGIAYQTLTSLMA